MHTRFLIVVLMWISTQLMAAPMSYKGSITTMGEAFKNYSKIETSYAVSGKDSIGIKAFKAKGDGYHVDAGYTVKGIQAIDDSVAAIRAQYEKK